jgi:hypothetical protein
MYVPYTMRLPESAHTSQHWRIHEIAPDFRVEDVWALPTPGGPDDFGRLLEPSRSLDPEHKGAWPVRVLFALRWKLGGWLGWDDERQAVGARVPTLRDRLPADLRSADELPSFEAIPFSPLYVTEDEFAAEIANQTMHGVLHVGWVPAEGGGYRGQMAVLVKPNGAMGSAYMAAIKPFRYLIVYPLMLREFSRRWRASASTPAPRTTATRT